MSSTLSSFWIGLPSSSKRIDFDGIAPYSSPPLSPRQSVANDASLSSTSHSSLFPTGNAGSSDSSIDSVVLPVATSSSLSLSLSLFALASSFAPSSFWISSRSCCSAYDSLLFFFYRSVPSSPSPASDSPSAPRPAPNSPRSSPAAASPRRTSSCSPPAPRSARTSGRLPPPARSAPRPSPPPASRAASPTPCATGSPRCASQESAPPPSCPETPPPPTAARR